MRMVIKILHKCIIENDGKILLLKRADDDSLPGKWDFPGGNLEFLENFESCVRREALEESGLKISKIRRIGFEEIILKKKKKHYVLFFYEARANGFDVVLSHEHSDFKWVKKRDLFGVRNLHPLFRMSGFLRRIVG